MCILTLLNVNTKTRWKQRRKLFPVLKHTKWTKKNSFIFDIKHNLLLVVNFFFSKFFSGNVQTAKLSLMKEDEVIWITLLSKKQF